MQRPLLAAPVQSTSRGQPARQLPLPYIGRTPAIYRPAANASTASERGQGLSRGFNRLGPTIRFRGITPLPPAKVPAGLTDCSVRRPAVWPNTDPDPFRV